MGVFSQVLSLFETRMPSIEGPLPITSARVVEWLSGPPASTGARINSDTALRISAVWDCIDLVSRDIARTPLQVYFKTAAGRDTSYNHRLYALLHDSPNPYMTAFTFKQTLQAHKMLRGNAYAYIERDDRGQIIGLWPLRPDRMSPPVMSQSDSPTLLYTYHLPSGEARALTQSEVLHLRGLGTEGIDTALSSYTGRRWRRRWPIVSTAIDSSATTRALVAYYKSTNDCRRRPRRILSVAGRWRTRVWRRRTESLY